MKRAGEVRFNVQPPVSRPAGSWLWHSSVDTSHSAAASWAGASAASREQGELFSSNIDFSHLESTGLGTRKQPLHLAKKPAKNPLLQRFEIKSESSQTDMERTDHSSNKTNGSARHELPIGATGIPLLQTTSPQSKLPATLLPVRPSSEVHFPGSTSGSRKPLVQIAASGGQVQGFASWQVQGFASLPTSPSASQQFYLKPTFRGPVIRSPNVKTSYGNPLHQGIGLKNYFSQAPDASRCRCRKNARLECEFANGWIAQFSSGAKDQTALKSLYEELKREPRPAKVEEQISKDATRTFPDMQIYKEDSPETRSLTEILNSLASRYPILGYVQGMNFLVASIRYHIREDYLVFWTASYLIDALDFQDLCGEGTGAVTQASQASSATRSGSAQCSGGSCQTSLSISRTTTSSPKCT